MTLTALGVAARIAALVVVSLLLASCSPMQVAEPGRGPQLPGRQVWGHFIGHGLPDVALSGNSKPYGSSRPIDLEPPNSKVVTGPARQVPQALAAGLTGMQILQFDGSNDGTDWIDEWLVVADQTWRDSRPDFSVAPCILPKTYAGTKKMIKNYAALSRGRPSAGRVNGKLVVYIYAGRRLTVQDWNRMRTELAREGTPVVLVGDLGTSSSQYGNKMNPEVKPYVQAFDAAWLFDDRSSYIFRSFEKMMQDGNRPFAGGMMPGYNRETPNGGYEDPRGTRTMRDYWNLHLNSTASWVNLISWGDFVESTEIRPTSDWNVTRSDINAFYAAKFRGLPPPIRSAQAYVTTPKYVRVGEAIDAEGLVLNGSNQTVRLDIWVVDENGRRVGSSTTRQVGAGQAADVRTTIKNQPELKVGRAYSAQVEMRDLNGKLLQSVRGAPAGVYGKNDTPTSPMRRTYLSVPARKVLPGGASISVVDYKSPKTTVTAPRQVHTVEVIQNTRLAALQWNTNRIATKGPMQPQTIVGGQKVSAVRDGYYFGRVIDKEGRVAYTKPVYVRK